MIDITISMILTATIKKPGKVDILITAAILSLLWVPQIMGHGLKYHEFLPIDHRSGMDASVVNCVVQDSHGLIWLGTDRGLYSFDGYSAQKYSAKTQFGQGNDGVIYCAEIVDSATIWLGTDNGLVIFNTYTDKFETASTVLPDNIRAISQIDSHTYWIGSLNGLYRYDISVGIPEKINEALLPHQAIYTILRYDENTFYFGTYNGLCKYDNQTESFGKISLIDGHHNSNQLILSLLADYKRDCIWVGVEGALFAYMPSSNKSTIEPLFNGNSVKTILLDNDECLWAGTDNGLYIFEPATGKHRLLRHDALNNRSLLNNVVWSVFTDREQNIWVGTDAGASLFVNNDRYQVQSISELTGSNEGNQIISVLTDSKGNLWLGGNNGLIKVDNLQKIVWYQQNNSQYPLPHNKVRDVFEDTDRDIWIATDGSICRYNETNGQFIRYMIEDETHLRNANWSYDICQDETNKLWIATCLGGLFVVDKKLLVASEGKSFVAERNYYFNNSVQSLSGNMLQFVATDRDRNIWAGTYRAGVNKVDRLNQQVVRFTLASPESHLPSDDVTAMILDSDNFLWIAMRNLIMRMDSRSHIAEIISDPRLKDTYINALTDDGKRIWLSSSAGLFYIDKTSLKLNQINSGVNYYSSIYYDRFSKCVIAGGINEYVNFDPESILFEETQNDIFITSFRINDMLVHDSAPNFPVKFSQSIRFSRNIVLPHNYNNLSFSFSELSYNQLQNIQYANKLNGLDADWHFLTRGTNKVTYNNIPPGEYILSISRIGNDGTPMPNPLNISITVNHPWYSTRLAKGIYIVLFLFLITVFVNYFRVLNRLRLERIEKIKTMELTAHKIDFLTSISHELKTPLSLIIGPLGKIIEQAKPIGLKSQLNDVRRNALKMGSLIHQIMEASRQEFDGFGLIVSKTDVVAFVRSVVSVFEKPLEQRKIAIDVESSTTVLFIEADILKLEVILNNILSNASKFAPDNSVINVKIEEIADHVKLSVTDQGSGIDAIDLPHVFERFYQSPHTIPQNKEGSGVGLSIVKEYVQLHRGSVKAISDGINGTSVEILLPVRQMVGETEIPDTSQKVSTLEVPKTKPLLLIVEDNLEILSFMSKSLAGEFHCITAQNGKSGLEIALTKHPDLIVTDIMMPVMDGISMCKKLKENIGTASIPIVMLTAKDDKTTELLGYRTGADAFIAKPFEIGYLSNRLHQLLKGRGLLVQKARQEAMIKSKEKEVLSADEKLLATITQIIEAEITNPNLNVNVLSEKSGFSQKQVYRRIKSLTGKTAVDYIRSVRLKKAAILLSRKTFTVAEVMYMVGFNNHSYFAKRFHEMFGKLPTQYTEGGE